MKLRDLERHLIAHGGRKVGEGGKHTKWRSADGAHATAVPRHSELGRVWSMQSADSSGCRPLEQRLSCCYATQRASASWSL